MGVALRSVVVADQTQLDSAVTSYISQGFTVQQRSETAVTMFKAKKFEVLWAVLGFFLCLLPLLIYCIVYATQNDETVVISVDAGAPQLAMSPDRSLWWDGAAWQAVASAVPPNARRSDDGRFWWDGADWRPVPGDIPQLAALPTPEHRADGPLAPGAETA